MLTALQAETGGSSYVYARRIGSIIRESNAIVTFSQANDTFLRKSPAQSVANTADHSTAQTGTANIPTGLVLDAIIRVSVTGSSAGQSVLVSSLDVTDAVPSPTASPGATIGVIGSGPLASVETTVRANTSAQFRYRSDSPTVDTYIYTVGWVDARGKDGQ